MSQSIEENHQTFQLPKYIQPQNLRCLFSKNKRSKKKFVILLRDVFNISGFIQTGYLFIKTLGTVKDITVSFSVIITTAKGIKWILESSLEFAIREVTKDKAHSSQWFDALWIMSIKNTVFGWLQKVYYIIFKSTYIHRLSNVGIKFVPFNYQWTKKIAFGEIMLHFKCREITGISQTIVLFLSV